jgi:hypothetical protein
VIVHFVVLSQFLDSARPKIAPQLHLADTGCAPCALANVNLATRTQIRTNYAQNNPSGATHGGHIRNS